MNLVEAKQRLLAAKSEIEGRLERTHKHLYGKEEPVSPNFHEQVVETGNDALVQRLEAGGRAELQQINNALQRIENGDYESCGACGKAIGEARLVAIPYTDRCINCA
jgi:DnaK suppressor protein